ncbi:MAG TPA: pyruvate kinase [Bacteroidia bacterium]
MLYPVLTYSRDLGDFSVDLLQLHQNGLKALRLIYKGKSESDFLLRIDEIQNHLKQLSINLDLFIDLPGNKPCIGNLGKGLKIQAGTVYQLVRSDAVKAINDIPTLNFFDHKSFSGLNIGDTLSIADDELNMRIVSLNTNSIDCEAINDFHLNSNRSISSKDHPFDFEANSGKDLQLVTQLNPLQTNIKLLVSFTKTTKDLLDIKAIQPRLGVVAKIENTLDDDNLKAIIQNSEMLMLGRGDLSTTYKPNELYAFQERLITLCAEQGKLLIIGTGLLTGIGEKLNPSIAEIMDYAHLRSKGIKGFLLTGANASKQGLATLQFMNEFEG